MKKIFILICFGLLLVSGCRDDAGGGGASFEYDKGFEGDKLKVVVRVDRLKVSASDTLLVEFEAVGALDTVVTFPDLLTGLDEFDVIDTQIVDDRIDADGEVVRAQSVRLEPMVMGKVSLPAFRFEYVLKGETTAKELECEAVEVEVVSVLGDAAADVGIAEIEGVVGLRDYTVIIWVAVIGAIVLAALAAVLVRRKDKGEREVERMFRCAHEIALGRLKQLEDEGLVSDGQLKIFYERVSNILRYYIEDRFALKAPERTTEEFLFELKLASVLAEADKDSLERFLRHCDLVKFARHEPSDEQVRLTVDLVRDFVDRTKSDESLVEITD